MIRTYKYKLYHTKRLRKIDKVINIAGIIYNHCIALHKRYYRIFGKTLNKFQLKKHLTKLKKYEYWKKVPSQAMQEITDRIDKAYKLFYRNKKQGIKTLPPTFKKVFKYKSYTLKQAGYKIENNIVYLKYLKELKKFSKKQKDSNSRKKAKRKLVKLHIKVVNTIRDYFHKLSTQIANSYNYVAIEDLNIKAMQKIWGKKISDLAFSKFLNILEYKTNLIKIDRFYPSSKTCLHCGYVLDSLDLNVRTWQCPNCQTTHNRDINASMNICRVGASTLGIGEVRPAIVGISASCAL